MSGGCLIFTSRKLRICKPGMSKRPDADMRRQPARVHLDSSLLGTVQSHADEALRLDDLSYTSAGVVAQPPQGF